MSRWKNGNSHVAAGSINLKPLWRAILQALGPPNPLLSIYSRETVEHVDKQKCTKMFIVTVLVIATNCKLHKKVHEGTKLHNG